MPKWLPENVVRAIHSALLAEHGGLPGPINEDMLGATLARPKHLDNYGDPKPSLFLLASAYGFGFAKNHCFRDGNKRIALAAIDVFLQLNSYELIADEIETVAVINDLAASQINETELAAWIKKNAQKLKN